MCRYCPCFCPLFHAFSLSFSHFSLSLSHFPAFLSHFLAFSFARPPPASVTCSRARSDGNHVKALGASLSNVYRRIMKSHDNIQAILANVRSLSETALCRLRRATNFIAAPNKSDPCSSRAMAAARVQAAQVDQLKRLIARMMAENFRLLFDLSRPCVQSGRHTNAVRRNCCFSIMLGLWAPANMGLCRVLIVNIICGRDKAHSGKCRP